MQGKLKRSLAIMAAAIVKICNAPNQVDHPHIEFKKFLKYLPFFFDFAPIILWFFSANATIVFAHRGTLPHTRRL